jgi:beta-N-acetylhexosaminidase
VAKHFPGHGGSAVDPHDEVTPIALSREELARVDWIPFETVIAAGIEAVMVGHPVYDALDPRRPASLSPPVYELLRSEFGFDGVALTDALNMPAVTTGRTVGEIAVAALAAGADLLVNPAWSATEPTVAAIVAAVASGDLSIDRLSEAASRVEALAASAAPVTCALQSGS